MEAGEGRGPYGAGGAVGCLAQAAVGKLRRQSHTANPVFVLLCLERECPRPGGRCTRLDGAEQSLLMREHHGNTALKQQHHRSHKSLRS